MARCGNRAPSQESGGVVKKLKLNHEMRLAWDEGRKTQARMPMDPQPLLSPSHDKWACVSDVFHDEAFKGTPAEGLGNKGERKKVWYSEDWCGNLIGEYGPCPYGSIGDTIPLYEVKAWVPCPDCEGVGCEECDGDGLVPELELFGHAIIEDIGVERVQDISGEDAEAEGVGPVYCAHTLCRAKDSKENSLAYRVLFKILWNDIYGPDAWDRNDWVWKLTLRKAG